MRGNERSLDTLRTTGFGYGCALAGRGRDCFCVEGLEHDHPFFGRIRAGARGDGLGPGGGYTGALPRSCICSPEVPEPDALLSPAPPGVETAGLTGQNPSGVGPGTGEEMLHQTQEQGERSLPSVGDAGLAGASPIRRCAA